MRTFAHAAVIVLLASCSGGAEERAQAEQEEAQRQLAAEAAAREQAATAAQAPPPLPVPAAAVAVLAPISPHTPFEVPGEERAGGDTPWSGYAGDGFHYQVPPGFTSMRGADGGQAWTGSVTPLMGGAPVTLVIEVARAPFAGDLAAWEAAQNASVSAAGGTVESMDAVIFGAGGGPAKQLTITEGDRRRLVRGFVRDGVAFTATCEADTALFVGVMATCAIAVSTLHTPP